MQDPSYSNLLQISDANGDLITLEELRPVDKRQNFNQHYETTYYDSNNLEQPCSSGMYKIDLADTPHSSDVIELQEVDTTTVSCGRKRKASLKQNHSEIEKRRRDKMNTYITELSSMIPMCTAMSRKLDKITVLKMAVDYLKTIRGPAHSYTETHYKPPYITDQELKQLILQVADGFVFVVGCDRGKILYVSESVSKVLHFSQNDLLRQSLFDILHPKDVSKVKEQLSSTDHNPRDRFIGTKISRLCPGARRSFFCRMKCNLAAQMKNKPNEINDQKSKENQTIDRKYTVIHCIGYLKSWSPTKLTQDDQDNDLMDNESYNISCLIAVGRTLPNLTTITSNIQENVKTEPIQFVSKHALDGKFIFVDQRVTLVLGFLPQELLGSSIYEYIHQEDVGSLAETHKIVLHNLGKLHTKLFKFKTKDGVYLNIQSEWRAFKNPWTKETEYFIAKNNWIKDPSRIENNEPRHEQIENLDFINERNHITETPDDGIIKLMEDVTRKTPNNKQQADGNDEAAMAIIMSLLEVDAGLGGPVDFSGLPWPLP